MRDLIAISGKQFAGKDLLADYLLQELPEFQKIPLAKAIKTEFANLYGLTPHEVEAKKSVYRAGLIAIGQRRRQADPDYWIHRVLEIEGPKIISDMRMMHEYETLKDQGAFLIRVEAERDIRAKRGTLVKETDPTECELDAITNWDALVHNNDTPEALQAQARQLAQRIRTI